MSVTGIIEAMRTPPVPRAPGAPGERSLAYRLVWQCLENHANGARFWRMTEADICAELRLSRSTVSRAISALAANGIIEVDRFKRRPSVFRMMLGESKSNGKSSYPHTKLRVQDDDSTPEPHAKLRVHNAESTPELRVQIAPTKTPPVRIHQKEQQAQEKKPTGDGGSSAYSAAAEPEAEPVPAAQRMAAQTMLGKLVRRLESPATRPAGKYPAHSVDEQIASASQKPPTLSDIHPAVLPAVLAARRAMMQVPVQRQAVHA